MEGSCALTGWSPICHCITWNHEEESAGSTQLAQAELVQNSQEDQGTELGHSPGGNGNWKKQQPHSKTFLAKSLLSSLPRTQITCGQVQRGES